MSTYSANLRIELPTSGTQAGVWGDTTNNNLAYILDTSVAGYQAVSLSATTSLPLTFTNGPASTAASNQAVYAMLQFNTATAASAVYAPPASKTYIIWNNSGYAVTVYNSTVIGNTTAAGAGVVIANGDKVLVWSNGTNFYDIKANNITGTLAIANGGTGQTTAGAALNALLPVQTTANGKYLQSDGTNASWDAITLTSSASASVISGVIYTVAVLGSTTLGQWQTFFSGLSALPSVGQVITATATGTIVGGGTVTFSEVSGILGVANGGTGQATALTQYGILYGSTTTAMATTLAGTSSQVLHGNASGAPSWGSVALGTEVTGTLAATNGGTGQSTYTTGDTLYSSAANTLAKLAGNTTTTRKYLVSVGTGTVATAPDWDSIDISTGDITGTLAVANGGTGVTTSTGTGNVVLSISPALTGTPTAPTAANTTDSTQIATTAFVRDIIPTGVITMWYGSIASIPSGWYLCDGANGTPNLRDKFIVGAGSTYAVAAVGGSADAIVVSHTHTATSTFTGSALGTHTHTATDSGHTHTLAGNAYVGGIGPVGGGANLTNASTVTTATGTANISVSSVSAGTPAGTVATTNSTEGASGTGANLPPYYALAYIMKA